MKKILLIFGLLIILALSAYIYLNISGKIGMISLFICGILLGILLMNFVLNVKNQKLNSYKRELEKESINSTENSSRVKVLEAKIEVLEKALENALKK